MQEYIIGNKKPCNLINIFCTMDLLLQIGLHVKDPRHGELFHAVSRGDLPTCILLCEEYGISGEISDKKGYSPLHFAAYGGYSNICNYLLCNGANPSATTEYGFTPLHFASEFNHVEICTMLLFAGAKVDHKTLWYGNTPLHNAIGSIDLCKLLFAYGAYITLDDKGRTPYHDAARNGNVGVVELFLEKESLLLDLPTKDSGNTALMESIKNNQMNVFEYLLNKGANPNIPDRQGRSPLYHVVITGKVSMCKLLIEKEANILEIIHLSVEKVRKFHSLLYYSFSYGQFEISSLLAKAMLKQEGSIIFEVSNELDLLLWTAVQKGNVTICELLRQLGADMHYFNVGQSLLHEAVWFGHVEICHWILRHETKLIHAVDYNGRTVLHDAARSGQLTICKLLVDTNLEMVLLKDLNDKTALNLALTNDVKEYLSVSYAKCRGRMYGCV